jgi:hypothetical protein
MVPAAGGRLPAAPAAPHPPSVLLFTILEKNIQRRLCAYLHHCCMNHSSEHCAPASLSQPPSSSCWPLAAVCARARSVAPSFHSERFTVLQQYFEVYRYLYMITHVNCSNVARNIARNIAQQSPDAHLALAAAELLLLAAGSRLRPRQQGRVLLLQQAEVNAQPLRLTIITRGKKR